MDSSPLKHKEEEIDWYQPQTQARQSKLQAQSIKANQRGLLSSVIQLYIPHMDTKVFKPMFQHKPQSDTPTSNPDSAKQRVISLPKLQIQSSAAQPNVYANTNGQTSPLSIKSLESPSLNLKLSQPKQVQMQKNKMKLILKQEYVENQASASG